MSALNQRMRNVAQALIERLGADAVLVVPNVVKDKEEGRVYEQSSTEHAVRISPPEPYYEFGSGQRVETRDLTCMLAAQGNIAPQLKQRVRVFGREFEIVGVEPVYAGNDPAAYTLRLAG